MQMNVSPKIKKVVACFVLMLMTCQFVLTMTNGIANAAGGPYLVTVKWTIPSDYTIQIGYVTGKGEIDFTSFTKKNGTIGADSQVTTVGSRVYAMNITNVGNTNVYVHANFQPVGQMASARCSVVQHDQFINRGISIHS